MKVPKKVLFIFRLLILIFFTSSNKLEDGVGNVIKIEILLHYLIFHILDLVDIK